MASIPHCTSEAGGHERAGRVRKTVRDKCGGHAVALDGEVREGAQSAMPERPLLRMAQKFNIQSLGLSHRQQETI